MPFALFHVEKEGIKKTPAFFLPFRVFGSIDTLISFLALDFSVIFTWNRYLGGIIYGCKENVRNGRRLKENMKIVKDKLERKTKIFFFLSCFCNPAPTNRKALFINIYIWEKKVGRMYQCYFLVLLINIGIVMICHNLILLKYTRMYDIWKPFAPLSWPHFWNYDIITLGTVPIYRCRKKQ